VRENEDRVVSIGGRELRVARSEEQHANGFSLIEVLVAALIACTILSVLLRLAVSAQEATRVQADVADLQQRLRVAADALYSGLVVAGSGPPGVPWRRGAASALTPIVPARTGARGADPELSYYADRVSIVSLPSPFAVTTLAVAMPSPGAPLLVDSTAPDCAGVDACGFAQGDQLLVCDPEEGGNSCDIFTAAGAQAGLVSHDLPLSKAYGIGSRLMRVAERVYYFDRAGARLMVYDGQSSDLPIVDHVVDVQFGYFADLGASTLTALAPSQMTDGPIAGAGPHRFDADLLRVRRIRVVLRVETEAADLRGAGTLLRSPGTSAGGGRWVPDQRITFDVTPENLSLGR
jgi:prepilin-type N-terminal cleavage/methylation domain-containing protein